jgi:OmpA-OmpF porin, OOP family
MNVKPIISSISQKNISEFLGESSNSVSIGLDNCLDSFLNIINKFVDKPNGSAELLQILSQGGHTGDVVQNLHELTTKPEKIQLLIKIGSNIVQHFAGDNVSDIIDTIAGQSGARKTSVNSLLNLAGPLVLGQIGKFKNDLSLDERGLKTLLLGSGSSVAPSAAVQNTIEEKPVERVVERVTESVQERVEESPRTMPVENNTQAKAPKAPSKGLAWKYIVPWTILAIVGIFPFVKNGVDFKKIFAFKSDKTEIVKDSLSTSKPEDFLPEPNVNQEPTIVEKNTPKAKDDGFDEPIAEKKPTVKAEESKSAFKEAKKEIEKPKEAIKPIEKPKEIKKVEKVAAPIKVAEKPKKEKNPESFSSENKQETSKEPAKDVSKLPAGYNPVSSSIFGRNNAEIKNGSSLNQYVSKTIVISPTSGSSLAEDRAYAIKEYLLEKGNQNVSVGKKINGSSTSLVSIKVE